MELIHLTGMEQSLKTQYQNATNVSARIRLHRDYSVNRQGWFPWVFEQCRIREGQKILELGCGNGALWTENRDRIPGLSLIHISSSINIIDEKSNPNGYRSGNKNRWLSLIHI